MPQMLLYKNFSKLLFLRVIIVIFALPNASFAVIPSVTTQSPFFVSTTRAEVGGLVNPNDEYTFVWVEFGDGSKTEQTIGYQNIFGNTQREVTFNLAHIQPGKTYSFRLVAMNNSGTRRGGVISFTAPATDSGPGTSTSSSTNSGTSSGTSSTGTSYYNTTGPQITSNGSSGVFANEATFNGSVNPNGFPTTVWFEYGTTNQLGSSTPKKDIGSENKWILVTETVKNLSPNTTYYYRFVAQNNVGINWGNVVSFTTTGQSFSPIPTPVPAPAKTAVPTTRARSTGTTVSKTPTPTPSPTVYSVEIDSYSDQLLAVNTSNDFDDSVYLILNTKTKARAGEEINFDVFYTNFSEKTLRDAEIKIILAPETELLETSRPWTNIVGKTYIYDLDFIYPGQEETISVKVKISDTAAQGKNVILSSIFNYRDRSNLKSVASYLSVLIDGSAVETASDNSSLFASIFGSLGIISVITVLLILSAIFLAYLYKSKSKKDNKKNISADLDIIQELKETQKLEELNLNGPKIGDLKLPVVK